MLYSEFLLIYTYQDLLYMNHSLFYTARKTIFSFSRRPEKMVFPKKLRWNMIFLVLSGKMIFLFPENMILHLRRKMKDDLSQKIHGNMIFSSNVLKRCSFQEGSRRHMIFLVLPGKMVFFSPKTWYFFPRPKVRGDLSQEIHGNMTFSVYTYWCYKRGATPLYQKTSKMVLSRKNARTGDWRSRLIS